MPRQIIEHPITTRAARERLAIRREPYWRSIEATVALGYRRGATGGSWVVRIQIDGRYRETAIGRADDAIKPDGVTYLDFRQAEAKARLEASNQHHIAAGLDPARGSRAPYTVEHAMTDYLAAHERRGGKSAASFRATINAHIVPELGPIRLDRLTRTRLTRWRDDLAAAAPRVRSRAGATGGPKRRTLDPADHDAIRARRATANRIVSVLKAALNMAHHDGHVHTKAAWELVKPFREVNAPRIRHLTDVEVVRLVNACDADLRLIVIAAVLTGMRYGEIAKLRAADFGREAGIVTVSISKSGKPRHIYLTDEGQTFFAQLTAGRPGKSLVFARANGEPWGKSHQFRPLRDACAAARIDPVISFHILRHTYASRLALAGTPLPVIAAQLGHTDTRMTERHYAHLTPNYVADVVRASFSSLGIVPQTNLASLAIATAGPR